MARPRRGPPRPWPNRWRSTDWPWTAAPVSNAPAASGITTACANCRLPRCWRPSNAGSAIPSRSANESLADQDFLPGRCDPQPAGTDRCGAGDSRYPVRLGGGGGLRRDSGLAPGGGPGDPGGDPPLAQAPLADPEERRVAALQAAPGRNPLRPGDRRPGPAEKRLAESLRQGSG